MFSERACHHFLDIVDVLSRDLAVWTLSPRRLPYVSVDQLWNTNRFLLSMSLRAPHDPGAWHVQEHPLAVVITVKAQPPRTIRLRWLTALQLVTAGGANKAERDMLAALFPGDDGLYIMSQVAHAAAGGHLTWDQERLDRPYRWGPMLQPSLPRASMVYSQQ